MSRTYKIFSVLLIISFLSLGSYSLSAQQNRELINSRLQSEQAKNNWLSSDISDYVISDQYTERETGLTHAYIQQRHNKIIVYNAISNFLIKDNRVLLFTPGIIDHLSKKVKTDKPTVTPEAAIGYALIHLGRNEIAPVKPVSTDVNTNTLTYESPGISASPIKVQLVYRAMDEGVYLAWDVSIEMKNEPHWWNVRINALTGEYLDKNDFVANCSFDDPNHNCLNHDHEMDAPFSPLSPLLPPVPAEYTVFPFPIEAPSFGSRSLLSGPSDNTASPFGWHDDNGVTGAEYAITRGNNVYAYEDANNDNLPGYSPNSGTLQFNYPLDLSQAPLVNQDASITNLFYDCNRIHDVLYHAGFTEAAGNFQQNNYGNGGLGNDKVLGEAFDGSGTNNANFATPADGASGRMQMYLWTAPNPDRDGSFDNGIVAHEYGHGLSNRLTGGPSQAGCLGNSEQGGEGWSDWLALIMTIEPSDTGAGFLGQSRGIGTYALNQATSGVGIRRFRYSTNMAINPQTYADLASSSGPHQKGEIWCDPIWDMTSFLVNDLGFSSDPTVATAGNNIAMRLVLEGMKLQPCSPGYIDGRDAILLADNILYGDAHRCRIWEAFARRGMGFGASQGSSNSSTDQTVSFALPPFCLAPTQPPVAGFTSNTSTIACAGSVQFTDTSTQAFAWAWNFGDQTTSSVPNPSHVFTSPGVYNVKLVVTNPLGSDSVTHPITVTPTYSANVTATPNPSICGAPVQLNAVGTGSSVITYSLANIPYAPLSGTPINVPLTDDVMSSAKPIGFNFNFFGQTYSNFYICSNGFISFSAGQPAQPVYGQPIPSTSAPNNLIALAWNDLDPTGVSTAVSYFNTGVPPNQKLVITYNTRHFGGLAYPFVVQAILSQGSNEIEIHTTTISNASAYDLGATTTQGLENAGGTAGVAVPGRNGTIFAASNDAYRFTPYTAYTYSWLPGNLTGATQTINPVANSTYTVNVADGSGCVIPFTTPLITVNPLTVAITGSPTFCAGGSTTLDAGSYNTYNWSTGATTQTIIVSTAGTYTVSVSNINGCTGSGSITTSISSSLTPAIGGNTAICAGNSTTLDAGIYASYLWSTGETTQSISVNTLATFIVTVSDGSGCTGSASATTTINTPPSPVIVGNTNLCVGGSTLLSTGLYSSYIWSTGATTQSITVITAGTFTVTVTETNGCTASSAVTTSFYPQPAPVITGNTSICTGTTTVLNAGVFNFYLWSTGSTSQTITAGIAGAYSVTVSDGNGCTGTGSVTVVVNPLPTPTITGAALFCPGDLIPLDAGAFSSYIWSTGATTQIAVANAPGTYTVTVTDSNGCTGSTSHIITANTVPVPPVTGNYSICQFGSVPGGQGLTATVTVGGSFTTENKFTGSPYSSNGPVTTFGTVTVPAIPAGSVITSSLLKLYKVTSVGASWRSEFRVALTGAYTLGATQVSTLNSGGIVTPDPVINLSGFPSAGGAINLVLSESFDDTGVDATVDSVRIDITYNILPTTITWWDAASGGSQVGTGTPFDPVGSAPLPNSNTSGNYTFYAQGNSSACNSSRTAAVFTINASPTPSISGNTVFCAGGSTILDAGIYSSYLWSTGASTQTIPVNTTGTFTVTVTGGNGCTGSSSVTTTAGSLSPAISGTLVFCAINGTTLNAGAGYTSYNWSTGATTQTIPVNSSGTFTVTVSDALGCTGSTAVTTTANPNPATSISGSSAICAGSSTLLNAGAGFSSYSWSTGVTTQTISVNATGTFTVTVTNAFGCTGTASKSVTVNPNPATSITGVSVVCAPGIIVLDAGAGFSVYNWSTSATTQTINVNTTGSYTVTVANAFGCTGSTSKSVTVSNGIPAKPGVITGANAVCKNSNVPYSIALVPGATSYTWTAVSGASVSTGQGSANVVVNFSNAATNASLSVVSSNICGSSAARTLAYVVSSVVPSQPSTINGQLYGLCNLTNVAYSCPVAANAVSYLWTVPAGVTILTGQGTNAITVKFGGTFTTTGTISVQAVNGCGSTAATSRTLNAKPQQPLISGLNWACKGQAGLTYSVAAVPGATSYTWTPVPGSIITSGQGTTSITYNWGSINGVIKCVANNACGSSLAGSFSVAFTCKEAGTIEDFSELNLFPNPASTSAEIQFDGYAEGKGELAVFDLIGKQVMNQNITVVTGNNNYKIDLCKFAKGAYMVKVTYNGLARNCKLIVQ